MGHEGAPEAGGWVWAEGGAPAGSRRVEVVEARCSRGEASAAEARASHVEA